MALLTFTHLQYPYLSQLCWPHRRRSGNLAGEFIAYRQGDGVEAIQLVDDGFAGAATALIG
jgi:hypothetical protein